MSVDARPLLTRHLGPLVCGTTAVGLLLWLAWRAGGYFPESFVLAGAVAFAVLALVLVALPPRHPVSDPALVALSALRGLALWTGLSSRWSSVPDTALEDFARSLTYVGLFGLGLLAAGSGRTSRHVVWSMLAVIVIVVGAGLVSRLYPDLIARPPADAFTQNRLAYPLTYWNAFGALGRRRHRPGVRARRRPAVVGPAALARGGGDRRCSGPPRT